MTCRKEDYSASIVARAVEDCDAHLLNLNVTSQVTDSGDMVVELRVGINNGESVARSLARYGYEVVKIEHNSVVDNDSMRRRIDELMHYINL
jgi:ribosomal protein S11